MTHVVDLDSALSKRIIAMLEKPSLNISGWKKQVARLEEKHGMEIYRNLFFVLANLDLTSRKAKTHWQKLTEEWEELTLATKKTVDLRVAALHFLLQTQKKLKNPTVVEIRFLQKAQGSAIRDELTRVYNYRYFKDRIDQEIKRVNRYDGSLSLLMVDVDDFKKFNDHNGHLAGNAALRKLAHIFSKCVRGVDVVCRYGGEEFAIILPSTPKSGALTAAEKIRQSVEKAPIPGAETQPKKKVTVSIGVATVPMDASRPEKLVERADAALYKAKAAGKNRVEAFSVDRREFTRYDAVVNGSLRALDEVSVPIETSNVSQGGLLIMTNQPFAVGSLLQVELRLPRQRRALTCMARVVRCIEQEHDYEVGIKIVHWEHRDRYRMQRFLNRLEKSKTQKSKRPGPSGRVKKTRGKR
jgi:diguanylate cyclase (GGDEF)-like protein